MLGNVSLSLASILIALCIGEATLRLTDYGEKWKPKMVGYYYPRNYHKPDAMNGHDISPNYPPTAVPHVDYVEAFGTPFTVSSNELGCRDAPMSTAEPYLLLLGDSYAWGYVPFESAFGTLLEKAMGVRVVKCGVSGYGPRHERYKLEQVVKQIGPPKLVVVAYYVGNDLVDDYLYPEYTVIDGYMVRKVGLPGSGTDRPGHDHVSTERVVYRDAELIAKMRAHQEPTPVTLSQQAKSFLMAHFVLYNVLRNSAPLRHLASIFRIAEPPPVAEPMDAVFQNTQDFPWLEEAWAVHLQNLTELKLETAQLNAGLVVVMIPTREQVYDFLRPPDQMLDWEYPNRRLMAHFNDVGIDALDLLLEFRTHTDTRAKRSLDPRHDLYWSYDRHLNVEGNRLMASLISRHLLERWTGAAYSQLNAAGSLN